jgi:hypothetical protein
MRTKLLIDRADPKLVAPRIEIEAPALNFPNRERPEPKLEADLIEMELPKLV